MCDTIVATGAATADGVTLFGKNSDREPNEAHHLSFVPAADHPVGSKVKCTYIEIPQEAHTYAVLLAKPYWIWGAEMGVNEHGVAIGNEAIFSKVPANQEPALLGMDLLRLGLERAVKAKEALAVITDLLAIYGQGGNCAAFHKMYYHNSFIIADPGEAWVLETVDRHWAAKKVGAVYAISNGLTIGSDWDLASPDLVNFAVEKGWCKGKDDFHFARCYSDFLYTTFSDCRRRQKSNQGFLLANQGKLDAAQVMAALRDHGGEAEGEWRPDRGLTGATVCMHAGFGPVRGSQTTGSIVSHLHPQHPTHFVTGTAAPCTSLFKPAWLDAPPADLGPEPNEKYDPATLFWRHERLHRQTLLDYPARMRLYREDRDALERDFTSQALACASAVPAERSALSNRCFAEASAAEDEWLGRVSAPAPSGRGSRLYQKAWQSFNRAAGLDGF